MTRPIPNRLPAARRGLAAAALLAAAGVAGCKGLLDVENPNNVIEENISTVAAAPPLANGVLAITVRAFNAVLDPFSTASDELDYVASAPYAAAMIALSAPLTILLRRQILDRR